MNKKMMALGALGCALGGAAMERAYTGGNVAEISQKETDRTQKKIVKTIHEEDKPDGTKIIDSTITDNSEIVKKIVEKARLQEDAKIINWQLAVGIDTLRVCSLSIDRRVLGPVTIGAGYSLNGIWQGRLGVEF